MKWVITTGSVLGITFLAVVMTLFFTGHQETQLSTDADVLTAVVDANKGAVLEGIKVHGEWRIKVTDPDGTLVKNVGFSNKIQYGFLDRLPEILTGKETVGDWRMTLDYLHTGKSPCGTDAFNLPCFIRQDGKKTGMFTADGTFINPEDQPDIQSNLVVTTVGPSNPSMAWKNKILLNAKFTAAQAGTLTTVGTTQFTCINPQDCKAIQVNYHSLQPDYIDVKAGQKVEINVDISFQ